MSRHYIGHTASRSGAGDEALVAAGVVAVAIRAAGVRVRRERGPMSGRADHVHERFVDADHVAAVQAPWACVSGLPW